MGDDIYRTGQPCKPCNTLGTVHLVVNGKKISTKCKDCEGKGKR